MHLYQLSPIAVASQLHSAIVYYFYFSALHLSDICKHIILEPTMENDMLADVWEVQCTRVKIINCGWVQLGCDCNRWQLIEVHGVQSGNHNTQRPSSICLGAKLGLLWLMNKREQPLVLMFSSLPILFNSQVISVSSSQCSVQETLRVPITRYCLRSSGFELRTVEFSVRS